MFQDQLEFLSPITSEEEYTRMDEAEIKESLGYIDDDEQATVEEFGELRNKFNISMCHEAIN